MWFNCEFDKTSMACKKCKNFGLCVKGTERYEKIEEWFNLLPPNIKEIANS